LSCFNPALFDSNSLPCYAKCKEDKLLNKGKRRPRSIPVIRPRIWLYADFNYLDQEAISKVRIADFKAKPDAVIVVSTALKANKAKINA
jgi:hypothetical protein